MGIRVLASDHLYFQIWVNRFINRRCPSFYQFRVLGDFHLATELYLHETARLDLFNEDVWLPSNSSYKGEVASVVKRLVAEEFHKH